MDLKQFSGSIIDIDEDWEITGEYPDIKHVYEEILFELGQYEGETADDFAALHDKTVYRILVILKTFLKVKDAEDDVINDLSELAEKVPD